MNSSRIESVLAVTLETWPGNSKLRIRRGKKRKGEDFVKKR
jgi:hypothetical protein